VRKPPARLAKKLKKRRNKGRGSVRDVRASTIKNHNGHDGGRRELADHLGEKNGSGDAAAPDKKYEIRGELNGSKKENRR